MAGLVLLLLLGAAAAAAMRPRLIKLQASANTRSCSLPCLGAQTTSTSPPPVPSLDGCQPAIARAFAPH